MRLPVAERWTAAANRGPCTVRLGPRAFGATSRLASPGLDPRVPAEPGLELRAGPTAQPWWARGPRRAGPLSG